MVAIFPTFDHGTYDFFDVAYPINLPFGSIKGSSNRMLGMVFYGLWHWAYQISQDLAVKHLSSDQIRRSVEF
jgi:hypothetical protein